MSDLAVGYIRVSKLRLDKNGKKISADESLGLEAQSRAIKAYAKLKVLRLLPKPLCDADVSGGKPIAKRPEGSRLLDMTKRRSRPVRHVVIFKLDRGFRNVLDCLNTVAEWDKQGVTLHIVDMGGTALDTTSAIGKIFLTMLAGFAQFERDMISERCKAAKDAARANGKKFSRFPPYGFRHDADLLVKEPGEQATLAKMLELRATGLSYAKLAVKLAKLKLLDRSGKPFDRRLLHKIVTRAA